MRSLCWGCLGLALCVQPGYAFGVVCKAIPSAAYDPSVAPAAPADSAAAVPADVDPHRDDWAKRDTVIGIEQETPAAGVAPNAVKATIADATVSTTTGTVSVNGTPLGGSPADVPKHVIVCKPVPTDK